MSEYSISNNGYSKAKDLDTISTTSSVMSAAAAAAVAGSTVNGSGAANANVSNGVHMNGMQTLPLVRGGGGSSGSAGNNDNGTAESPKHANNMTPNTNKPKFMVATPEQVMKLYMTKLTPYEHHEIFNYPQIYFIGANAKKRPGIIGGPNNCGYDDEQGSYTHIVHDHLAYRSATTKHIISCWS